MYLTLPSLSVKRRGKIELRAMGVGAACLAIRAVRRHGHGRSLCEGCVHGWLSTDERGCARCGRMAMGPYAG